MSTESTQISVLSQASIGKLREITRIDPIRIYKTEYRDLLASAELNEIHTPVKINKGVFLEPTGSSDTSATDVENCITAITLFPDLTPALAADDRLWSTLSLRDFREYAQARFPLRVSESEVSSGTVAGEKAKLKAVNHVTNHFFADNVRRRTRDNAVGRLWWMGHYAQQSSAGTTRDVLGVLLKHDLDIASSFLGRSSIASAPSVADAILTELVHDDGFAGYDSRGRRAAFRSFMKAIDLLAGRRVLSYLTREEIQPEVSDLYRVSFQELDSPKVYFS